MSTTAHFYKLVVFQENGTFIVYEHLSLRKAMNLQKKYHREGLEAVIKILGVQK
jgi:hypothetical protein